MRSTFDLDASVDYGEATPAIRKIIDEWTAVDWFVPVRRSADQVRARQLLEEYNALARAYLPDAFPEALTIRTMFGGWEEFASLCKRVRYPASTGWDWKYSALKVLCRRHSEAKGWRLDSQKESAPSLESQQAAAASSALFFRYGEHVMWAFHPKLDVKSAVRASRRKFWQSAETHIDAAEWYVSYANMDITHCIEWQLAEKSAQLDGNPFVPLMRCHAQGFLPICLGRDELALFAFGREPSN